MKNNDSQYRVLRLLPIIIGVLLGAVGGYLYYRYVGCVSGSCAISSNPYNSMLYFSVIGALVGLIIAPERKKKGTGTDNE